MAHSPCPATVPTAALHVSPVTVCSKLLTWMMGSNSPQPKGTEMEESPAEAAYLSSASLRAFARQAVPIVQPSAAMFPVHENLAPRRQYGDILGRSFDNGQQSAFPKGNWDGRKFKLAQKGPSSFSKGTTRHGKGPVPGSATGNELTAVSAPAPNPLAGAKAALIPTPPTQDVEGNDISV
jgi:hypothetical protein